MSSPRGRKSNAELWVPSLPVGIRSMGRYLPGWLVRNEDLVRLRCPLTAHRLGWGDGPGEADGNRVHLAVGASRAALANAGLPLDSIGTIVLGLPEPESSRRKILEEGLAKALGWDRAKRPLVQVEHPVSLTALGHGRRLIEKGQARRVLIIVEEATRRLTGRGDMAMHRSGGGTAALVLESCRQGTGFLAAITRSRTERPGDGEAGSLAEAYVEALKAVTSLVGVTPGDLDLVIPDQGRPEAAERALGILGLPVSRLYTIQHRLGYTSGGSILVALAEAADLGAARPGRLVATVGDGGAFGEGAQLIRLNDPGDFSLETPSNGLPAPPSLSLAASGTGACLGS